MVRLGFGGASLSGRMRNSLIELQGIRTDRSDSYLA